MTPETLRKLVAAGETYEVEFKGEERAPLSDRDLVEAVVCLSNRPGQEQGYLLVGVEDDGRITGARPRHGVSGTDLLRVQALIANRTRPALTCRADLVSIEDKQVLVVEVPAAANPVGTADGLYLRRALGGRGRPECLPYHFHEMQAQQASRGILDYSATIIPEAGWEDLDPLELDRFRRSIRESRGDVTLLDLPDLELAKALGAVEANHELRAVRTLGLLLFGREDSLRRLIPTHEVAFQVLSGLAVEVNEFFRWPLLRVMEELLGRFRARNREQEIHIGLLRVPVPNYSERAFREALANALIHRDYTRQGAVHVQWHPDQLEVSNPGGFPEGVRLDNLLVTPPRPRNPLLADAFKRAGLVERTARGIDTIFYEQLRNGRPAPDFGRSSATDVVLSLPGGDANLEFARLIEEENRSGRLLGLDEILVLNCLWLEREIDDGKAARLIQKPPATARAVLVRLVEAGLVEARGKFRQRTYQLSAGVYRKIGEKDAYARQRTLGSSSPEETILEHVRGHGQITSDEAARLCQISGTDAFRLLKDLTRQGRLRHEVIGNKTSVYRSADG